MSWEGIYDGHYIGFLEHFFFFFRRMTFHYKRSSLSFFGGVCSRTRGVGVNEVNLINFLK